MCSEKINEAGEGTREQDIWGLAEGFEEKKAEDRPLHSL